VETSERARLFDELIAAVSAMRDFLDSHGEDVRLSAREMHTLERLTERCQRADDAVNRHVEQVIRRSTGRPRR
jgi:hypothetical protein